METSTEEKVINEKCLEQCKQSIIGVKGSGIAHGHRRAEGLWRVDGFILVIESKNLWTEKDYAPNRGRLSFSNKVCVFDLTGQKIAESDYYTHYRLDPTTFQTHYITENEFVEVYSFSLEKSTACVRCGPFLKHLGSGEGWDPYFATSKSVREVNRREIYCRSLV